MDIKKTLKNNKSFCIKPFTEICNTAQNNMKLCCESDTLKSLRIGTLQQEFFHNKRLTEVRQAMLVGEKVTECTNCYDWEKNNLTSPRMIHNEKTSNQLIKKIFNGHLEIMTLDLKFGNKCNLGCTMCDATSSSVIALENLKDPGKDLDLSMVTKNPKISEFPEDEFSQIEEIVHNLHTIKSTGGEPMLLPGFKNLLTKLVNSNHAHHIKFRTVTNGTVNPIPLVDLMKQFERFTITFSIDGIGVSNDWIRWPCKFDKVSNTHSQMARLLNDPIYKNIKPQFGSTISVANIDQILPIFEYAVALDFPLDYDLVRIPEPMQAGLAPRWLIEKTYNEIYEFLNKTPDIDPMAAECLTDIAELVKANSDMLLEDPEERLELIHELKRQCEYWYRNRKLDPYARYTVYETLKQID